MSANAELIVLCGCPGSGKTTAARDLADKIGAVGYSYDELPGAFDPAMVDKVYASMHSAVVSDLLAGRIAIVDSVFNRVKRRRALLRATYNIECKKVLMWMAPSLDECLKRNARRTGHDKVPSHILRHIYCTFEIPTFDEGWDEIITIE